MSCKVTPKALDALKLLAGTNHLSAISASALAHKLWPEKLAECGTSRRRKGYARSAGAFYSKLQKQGLVSHWMDDLSSGYYITSKGEECLRNCRSERKNHET